MFHHRFFSKIKDLIRMGQCPYGSLELNVTWNSSETENSGALDKHNHRTLRFGVWLIRQYAENEGCTCFYRITRNHCLGIRFSYRSTNKCLLCCCQVFVRKSLQTELVCSRQIRAVFIDFSAIIIWWLPQMEHAYTLNIKKKTWKVQEDDLCFLCKRCFGTLL